MSGTYRVLVRCKSVSTWEGDITAESSEEAAQAALEHCRVNQPWQIVTTATRTPQVVRLAKVAEVKGRDEIVTEALARERVGE